MMRGRRAEEEEEWEEGEEEEEEEEEEEMARRNVSLCLHVESMHSGAAIIIAVAMLQQPSHPPKQIADE
jgi:hypothetical protein